MKVSMRYLAPISSEPIDRHLQRKDGKEFQCATSRLLALNPRGQPLWDLVEHVSMRYLAPISSELR